MKKGWGVVLLTILMTFIAGCVSDPDDPIKQPGKPNVVQYADPAEIEQWEHKVAGSILKHGVPGYAVKQDNRVELMVLFDSNIVADYADVVARKYGGTLARKDANDGHFFVQVPQDQFWEFVKDEKVKRVGVPKPPANILSRMQR